MKKTTLCFCVTDDEVLLGMKKRGFGAGKWNGYGGKVQENELPKTATVREIKEESGLVVDEKDLEPAAIVRFSFEEKPLFECFVYTTSVWKNNPLETEEMRPEWFPRSTLPFDDMWVADVRWVPLILSGKKIEADVNFSEDGSIVKDFTYKLTEFLPEHL
jgi:ADP-ribose pyrophosphatase YjhB (NUDIX family)